MTSTTPGGPSVDMPSSPPSESRTGPPSSVRRRRISRAIRCSIRPPARLYHCGPTALTRPSRAVEAPAASAPSARARVPTRAVARGAVVAASGVSVRRTSRFVPGSRPAMRALAVAPEAVTTSYSSRSPTTCSEVTTASGCHSVALTCRWDALRTATARPRAAATCASMACERRLRGLASVDIVGLPRIDGATMRAPRTLTHRAIDRGPAERPGGIVDAAARRSSSPMLSSLTRSTPTPRSSHKPSISSVLPSSASRCDHGADRPASAPACSTLPTAIC